MKLLERLKVLEQFKKEWPDFRVLVRSAGLLCARKIRKEDSTQEASQIRAMLPRTRCLQAAVWFLLVLFFVLIRLGCSSCDSTSSSKAKDADALHESSNQTDHLLEVGSGLKADRIDAVRASVKKRELREKIDKIRMQLAKLEERQSGCQSMKLFSRGVEPESNSFWRVEYKECHKLDNKELNRDYVPLFKGDENCISLIMRKGTLAFPPPLGYVPPAPNNLPRKIAILNVPFPPGEPEDWAVDDWIETYLPAGYYRATGTYLEEVSTALCAAKMKQSVDRGVEKDVAAGLVGVEMFARASRVYIFEKLSDEEYAHALNQQKNESHALAKKYKKEIKDLETEISQVDVWLKERFAANAISQKKAEEFAVSLLSQTDFTKVWNNVGISKAISEEVLDKVMSIETLKDISFLCDLQKKADWKRLLAFAAEKCGVGDVDDSEYPPPETTEKIIKRILTPTLNSDMFPLNQVSLVIITSKAGKNKMRELSDDREVEIVIEGDEVVYDERSIYGRRRLTFGPSGNFNCTNAILNHRIDTLKKETFGSGVVIDLTQEKLYVCNRHSEVASIPEAAEAFCRKVACSENQEKLKKEAVVFAAKLKQMLRLSLKTRTPE